MTEPDVPPDPLTRREREVLEGILDHRTAKEMAIEHGVSHHAIEKRLKRARLKLGASTSLEAARLHRDRYGRSVCQTPDLAATHEATEKGSSPNRRSLRSRSIAIMIVAILAIAGAIVASQNNAAPAESAADTAGTQKRSGFSYRVGITPRDGKSALQTAFDIADTDGSRTIDRSEFIVPTSDDGEADRLFDRMDRNGNGLIEAPEWRNLFFTDDFGSRFSFEIFDNREARNRYPIGIGRAVGTPCAHDMRAEALATQRARSTYGPTVY